MKLMTMSFLAASFFSLSTLPFIDQDQDIPQSEVPSVVLNALSSAYPNAASVEWEKVKDIYEAEFDIDTKEYTVQLSATGTILQTKQDLGDTELPEAVKSAIAANYKNYKLDDADLLEKDGRQYYQVELDGRLKDKKLVLDAAGKEQNNVSYWD
ncbi:PepSY-like domain-containing protein [Pontibacter burrus]|uniref:Putative beta-lactamase-inhibitor-like PepSY-like domain-containing protein n=1 Tax=Pontibacter burrus TaxID=2704466 RepID=A0A6B3LVS5_9BACT|nr:PepSY-like domain-containing protein [Pontibacter burrus]NEM97690.1 hypothetical protein [Pontibacter burrus]